jgi:hypothetical protein
MLDRPIPRPSTTGELLGIALEVETTAVDSRNNPGLDQNFRVALGQAGCQMFQPIIANGEPVRVYTVTEDENPPEPNWPLRLDS